MNAEFGIDDEGHAYVSLNKLTQTEWNMIDRLKAFLPVRVDPHCFEARITGDRLPGMGNLTAQYQDATCVDAKGNPAVDKDGKPL